MKKYKSLQALFRDKRNWTKHTYARDIKGREIWVCHPRAVSFCLSGALTLIYPHTNKRKVLLRAIKRVFPTTVTTSLPGFNDAETTTITDIRKVVKAAKL